MMMEPMGPDGEPGTPRRGRGRPRKYTEQSQVMYVDDGGNSTPSAVPPPDYGYGDMIAGEKRKDYPSDDEDSEWDGSYLPLAWLSSINGLYIGNKRSRRGT